MSRSIAQSLPGLEEVAEARRGASTINGTCEDEGHAGEDEGLDDAGEDEGGVVDAFGDHVVTNQSQPT